MKTLIKSLIQVHLESPADSKAESIGVAVRKVDETPADLCLNGYRMLLHCQGASSETSQSTQAKQETHTARSKSDSRTANRNTISKGR